MEEEQKKLVKQNVSNSSTWIRLLFVILYVFVYILAKYLVIVLATINFVANLTTGKNMDRVESFAKQMNVFIFKCLEYITFVSDDKPYPFTDWNSEDSAQAIHEYIKNSD